MLFRLHPFWQYKGQGYWDTDENSATDYDPAKAEPGVFIEFAPWQNEKSDGDLKARIEKGKKQLGHPSLKALLRITDKIFDTVEIKKIIALGLGTTNRPNFVFGPGTIEYAPKGEDDLFEEDEAPSIQHAFIFEIAKKHGEGSPPRLQKKTKRLTSAKTGCEVILQDPSYSNAEKSLFSSEYNARILDDPDAFKAIDKTTLIVLFDYNAGELAWWLESSPNRPDRPAVIFGNGMDGGAEGLDDESDDEVDPDANGLLVKKLRANYETVDYYSSGSGLTTPIPSSSVWVREDIEWPESEYGDSDCGDSYSGDSD